MTPTTCRGLTEAVIPHLAVADGCEDVRSVLKFRIGVSYLGDVRNVLRFWQDVVWSERLCAVSPFVIVESVRFEALPRLLNLNMDLGDVRV